VTLHRLEVATTPPYEVVVGPNALAELDRHLPASRPCAIVSDRNVARLHAERLGSLTERPGIALPPGEESKSFAALEGLLDFLVGIGMDRHSQLVAFGGGVIGDLTGLAAALFMRGIPCVQVPTTLLSQVDSSVGGKTAVNLRGGKNLAGAFHQPSLVLADTALLATLPEDELASGLGEVVKTALIGDPGLLELLESEAGKILARDAEVLSDVVARCVTVKAGVVARDPTESGERKSLNLGHTFAHGIEQAAGFGAVPHGIAVGVGLGLALEASRRTGLLTDPELPGRVQVLLERLGLPTDLEALRRRAPGLESEHLIAGMRHDKKGRAGEPAFVLVAEAGRILLDQHLEDGLVADLLA
jgi:3-dehydroquinate synthase